MGNCSICDKEDITKQEVIDLLLGEFYESFATRISTIIIKNNATGILYDLSTNRERGLSKSQNQKVEFRAAYILETIYFRYGEYFIPYKEKFCRDFSSCTNESAKRHFTKMMAHLLTYHQPSSEECEKIADASAQWAINPKARVAVIIGAIEVMLRLRKRVEWSDEIVNQIIEIVGRKPSPGMEVRLKRWNSVRTL